MTTVSVIIPAYGPMPFLDAVLSALEAGTRKPDEIIVFHTGPDDPTETVAKSHPGVTVRHAEDRMRGGAARNMGAEIATGDILAFCDGDVRPVPGWLAAIVAHFEARPDDFIVGSVGVAESGGYWGMVNWLSEFSEQAPWHLAKEQLGGASCSMAVRAEDFRAIGGFDPEMQPGEDTKLMAALRARGRRQWFLPDAQVDHFNLPGYANLKKHQFRLGYHSAQVREALNLPGAIAVRFKALAFILFAPRALRVFSRTLAGDPKHWAMGLGLLPGILVGAVIWNAGFLARAFGRPLS